MKEKLKNVDMDLYPVKNVTETFTRPAVAGDPEYDKKQKMIEELQKGNKIITMGGIYGSVQGFKEKGRQVVIKVDNNTNITINRTAIAGLAEKIRDEELEQT